MNCPTCYHKPVRMEAVARIDQGGVPDPYWMCPECGSTRLLDPVADVVDIITDLGFRLDRAEETIKELMKDLEDRRRYRD